MRQDFPAYRPDMKANVFRRRCPSNAVLDIIADKWSALLIARLHTGKQRHGELLHSIEGISQRMLTQTLRELERNGLVTRTVHPVIPPHVDYELTELGQSLYRDALKPLTEWAMHHMGAVVQARNNFQEAQPHQTG